MTEHSEAIILNRRDSIKENDEVVDLILSNGRIISVFCVGTKKAKSKNSLALNIATLSSIEFFKSYSAEKISRLKTAKLVSFYSITSEYTKSFLNYLEIINSNKIDGVELFNSLRTIIEGNYNFTMEIEMIILSKIYLSISKFPVLSKCLVCGITKSIRSFSFEKGGLLCDEHSKKEDVDMNSSQIKKLQNIFNVSNLSYSNLKIDIDDFFLFKKMIISYLKEIEGFYIDLN